MDSKGDTFGSRNDKRKSESELDSPCLVKKVCTHITSTYSSILPSEVSTSNIEVFPASSSDLKVISEQPHDLGEKLSFLTNTDSYLENQSLNIGSTTESLDGLQSEVSLSDINVDSFISASCETSQAVAGTTDMEINSFLKVGNENEEAVDTSTNVDSSVSIGISKDLSSVTACLGTQTSVSIGISKDLSSVTACLGTQTSEVQIPQTREVITTGSIASTLEKQSSEVTGSDLNDNEDLDSLETQIVSSSDQNEICTIQEIEDNSSRFIEGKPSAHRVEFFTSKICNIDQTKQQRFSLAENRSTTGISSNLLLNIEKEIGRQTECFRSESQISGQNELLQIKFPLHGRSSEDLKLDEIKDLSRRSSLQIVPSRKIHSEILQLHSSKDSVEQVKNTNTEMMRGINKEKLLDLHSYKTGSSTVNEKIENSDKRLTFEGSLKNVSLPSTSNETNQKALHTAILSSTEPKPQVPKIDSSFASLTGTTVGFPMGETEVELDKKSEISAMEIDSTNTPVEGSLVDTPCESEETSPSISTPVDSCQVSAAPSPLLKEDANLTSEGLLYDESSMDTKDIGEEGMDGKEQEEIKPVKHTKKKSKKATVENKKKGKTAPVLVDEETRMSANGTSDIGIDEDSQSSTGASSKREVRRYRCEVIVPESTEVFTADKVNEYLWPLDGMGEHYFIQEHIAQYLGVMSFKRKYPDLRRRPIESQEKEYLRDLGLVSEMACDLGLTAVRSEDVLDVMFNDFPSKYEELQRVLRERKEKQLKEKGKVEYQLVNLDKSKMQEYSRKAALNASKWNAAFNRERNEERRYTFDLQTFTLHMPIGRAVKLAAPSTKLGSYPVAVLPGQYTDYCKKFSTSELRGMPLQTVMSGPFTAEELAAEMQGIESDDESAAASCGTCPDTKEEPEVPPVVDPLSAEKQPRCKVCNGGRARNKDGKPEPLIICGTCRTASHPTCIDLTLGMIDKIESYSWQCMDCKTCAQCNDPDDEERMIFCDMCDRGYHIYCVGLRRVPNGRWHCKECAVCYTCGARNPSGSEHIKNAEWQHEFKKDKDNKQLKYACTLCVPCDKYWKRRQFCSVCMKVYRSIPEDGMVRCSGCPKYVHKDGCSIIHDNERFCNICFKSRNKTALNHSRIIAAAKKKMATGNTMWK